MTLDKGLIALGGAITAVVLSVPMIFAQVQSGSLTALNNSGVSGTYRLESVNQNQTRVTVTLQGLEPGTSHVGHFHEGTCTNIGPVTLPLNTIRADDSGRGSQTMIVDSSLQNIYSGQYLISYHEDTTNESQSITCGTIPARTINPNTNTTTPLPTEAPNTGLGGMSW